MDFTRIFNWKSFLEIVILWVVIYRIFVFLKGTKAVYLLRGILILLAALLLFQLLGFPVLTRILTYLFAFFMFLVAIIFQPELREGLIHLGRRHIFYIGPKREETEGMIREITSAIAGLSRKKNGALIAIRREMPLTKNIESGVVLNADLTAELVQGIFYPGNILHDGGVIVEGIKVIAAACLFPLSENTDMERSLGMRHRAALGLSEHTDALVVVVSEETGAVSLAINGQLTRNLSSSDLLTILKGQLAKPRQ